MVFTAYEIGESLFNHTARGEVEEVKKVLQDHEDIVHVILKWTNRKGWTALQKAIHLGNAELVDILIYAAAEHDVAEERAMCLALGIGNVSIIKALIGAKIDLLQTCYNDYEGSALHVAVDHCHLPVVKLLVSLGVDLESRDAYGETPLHLAVYKKDLSVLSYLIHQGACIHAQNQKRETPLHIATFNSDLCMVNALLDAGASSDSQDFENWTPLHCAVHNNCIEIVKALLNASADVNKTNKFGATALLIATNKGFIDLVRILLAAGATVHCQDNDGNTPLHVAYKFNYREIILALAKAGARKPISICLDTKTPTSSSSKITTCSNDSKKIIKKLDHKTSVPTSGEKEAAGCVIQ